MGMDVAVRCFDDRRMVDPSLAQEMSQDPWPWNQPVFYALMIGGFIAGMVVMAFARRRLSEQGFGFWAITLAVVTAAAILAHMFLIPGR